MATSTDVPIYTTTLTSTTTSVVMDISQFQGYKNLKIVYSAQNSGGSGAVLGMRFNSDTGSNYSATYGYGTGSTCASGGEANQGGMSGGDVPSESSGLFSANIIYVNNYSNTNMYKTAVMRHNAPGVVTVMSTGMWRSTAAITSITFYGATFTVGSTFSVYGIGTASLGAKATGGAIYSDANYFYHVFGSTGAFTPTQSLAADILVVGGGGGGGIGTPNGNGGGGGFVTYMSNQSLTSGTSYTCTVGAGAAGRIYSDSSRAATGGQSSFNSITAGGGTGGTGYAGTNMAGNSGSNINRTITNYSGSNATSTNNQLLAGGGGAGAGANGLTNSDNPSVVGSVGGDGLTFDILNFIEPNTYVGGGGNGGNEGTGSNGGWGPYLGYIPTYRSRGGGGWGGGQPVSNPANAPTNGTANRGGGGGGATWDNTNPKDANAANGANGGSGIVVVRYAK